MAQRVVLPIYFPVSDFSQIAISKFFDGETADPVEDALAAQASASIPREASRQETLLNSSGQFSRSSTSLNRDPAPRIVPQPENRSLYKPPLLLSLILAPFNIALRLLSGSLGLFGYLFPFLPRLVASFTQRSPSRPRRITTGRRPLNPRDTAARFIREFEEEYGSHDLHFFENGYAQAYDLAKKDLKYLLVILLSPEHDDTSTFAREVLLSPEIATFINNPENRIILWAGTVQDSEAYQVSIALNCTKFPFAGLIVHTPQDSSTTMSTVARITGLTPPSIFISKLRTAITQHAAALDRVRASRAEQEASRSLRQEQNSAYERSLALDRERMRLRKEAEAAKAKEEAEAKEKAEAAAEEERKVEQWKRWRAQSISAEPGADIKDATRLSIRMPSGDRIIRKFSPETAIEELYAFVECHDILSPGTETESTSKPPAGYDHKYKFNLVSPMPRVVYDLNAGGKVSESIGRSGNLIVEPILIAQM